MTALPGPAGLIDHRVYTIRPRGMDEFLEIFDRLGMPILLGCLGAPLGIYTSRVGVLNQVVHLWGYQDLADYDARCRARDSHPAFPAYLEASAHLITAQETRLLVPAKMSRLQTPLSRP